MRPLIFSLASNSLATVVAWQVRALMDSFPPNASLACNLAHFACSINVRTSCRASMCPCALLPRFFSWLQRHVQPKIGFSGRFLRRPPPLATREGTDRTQKLSCCDWKRQCSPTEACYAPPRATYRTFRGRPPYLACFRVHRTFSSVRRRGCGKRKDSSCCSSRLHSGACPKKFGCPSMVIAGGAVGRPCSFGVRDARASSLRVCVSTHLCDIWWWHYPPRVLRSCFNRGRRGFSSSV